MMDINHPIEEHIKKLPMVEEEEIQLSDAQLRAGWGAMNFFDTTGDGLDANEARALLRFDPLAFRVCGSAFQSCASACVLSWASAALHGPVLRLRLRVRI